MDMAGNEDQSSVLVKQTCFEQPSPSPGNSIISAFLVDLIDLDSFLFFDDEFLRSFFDLGMCRLPWAASGEARQARGGEGEPPGAGGEVTCFEAGEAFHVADDLCVDEDGVADAEERVGVGGKERSRQEDSSPSRVRVPLP